MRPDLRFVHDGPEPCTEADLLALILGGSADACAVARALIEEFGTLHAIARVSHRRLVEVGGLGRRRALRLQAAIEAGRRSLSPPPRRHAVCSARDAELLLGPPLRGLQVEELHALYLDRRRCPRAHRRLTRGTDGYTIVDPRQVFRLAIETGSSAVILAHNHPSGDPTPSVQDRDVTRRVARAGSILGVPLLDHLVVAGATAFVSLAEEGIVREICGVGPEVMAEA